MTFATSHVGDLEESGVLTHNQFPLSDPMPTFFYNVRTVMGASVVDALCRALRIGCSKAEKSSGDENGAAVHSKDKGLVKHPDRLKILP